MSEDDTYSRAETALVSQLGKVGIHALESWLYQVFGEDSSSHMHTAIQSLYSREALLRLEAETEASKQGTKLQITDLSRTVERQNKQLDGLENIHRLYSAALELVGEQLDPSEIDTERGEEYQRIVDDLS